MENNDKISLMLILNTIKDVLNTKHITNGKVEVVISWYRHAKDKVDFVLNESSTSTIVELNRVKFHIYDEFYSASYDKYDNIFIEPNPMLRFRVDYRVIRGDKNKWQKKN